MTCPMCNGDTKVTCTRENDDHVVRYRKCFDCGYMFTTMEIDEDIYPRLKRGQPADLREAFTSMESTLKRLRRAVREVITKLSEFEDKNDG